MLPLQKNIVFGAVAACALSLFALSSDAEELSAPNGPVILVVSGDIDKTTDGAVAKFDRDALASLGSQTVLTHTTWTDGRQRFDGTRISDILERVGANGTKVEAVALNDYRVELDVSELKEYPVILAAEMNGKPLSVRDKGPLWVVYPKDQHPLVSEDHKWIWQVRELHVK
ncbi:MULTISPECIES: molybdopterin-dependent oxidoreductase [Pseudovibrio]|uniref:molybdopterin-dependent oxidoreductase n=1 Tax=Stappiaceae TaxID=2821832 RepID=UPI0023667232|nr:MULTISPECIES: molybdopterin-dependent oxidoreductase [Pseudovibrio]MDD7909225.1 molybdopterin-dependent oxidoreductase [Pseudovibrio exalbescens]MDX5595228.1 molybdopterin-dependent oxidoreductase [Pseudovibrio sp. SPO723]